MIDLADKKYSFKQVKLLRSSIFFIVAFLVAVSCVFYYINGIDYLVYISAAYFFFILGCAFIYNRYNLFLLGRYLGFVITCTTCMVFSYVEGFESLALILFIPLIVVVPVLVDKKEGYRFQSKLFYFTWLLFLAVALVITRDQGIVGRNHPGSIAMLKTINTSFCFLLCAFYSLFGLMQERWFTQKLLKRKQDAENLKNERMSMLSSLGHEIRTQATSINAASQMLVATPLTEQQKPLVEALDYCSNQMFYLINDILDLRKIETGKLQLHFEPKNVMQILTDAILPFREKCAQKNIRIRTTIDKRLDGHIVMVDELRLNQVLHNLLYNAVKYTQMGQIVFSAVLREESDRDILVDMEVSDSGIGIKEEHLEKIFDSFWQVKSDDLTLYGGSGLGLTIAKNIISGMGSELKVESEIRKGSRFYFTLDFEKATFSPQKSVSEDMNHRLSGREILVVEDNPMSLAFTLRLLEQKGMKVLQASNGLKAIEIFRNAPQIPLVLLDLEMPEMNGFSAISALKNINNHARIIAFTAAIPDLMMNERLKNLGFDDFISKPFKKETLYEKIQANLS